jgi:3-oxoacyl-[acyl-carrier-protein] synthase I
VTTVPTTLLGTGLSCALGHGLATAAENLLAGRQPIQALALDELDPPLQLPCLRIPGEDAAHAERLYQLLDTAVAQALEQAGLDSAARRRTGILLGSTSMDISVSEALYAQALAQNQAAIPLQLSGYGNLAARIAERFGLHGPSYSFNTACSSAANALLYAHQMVGSGELDHALVLGVEITNRISLAGFHSLMLYAADTPRPFDAERQGLVLGEAIAAAIVGRQGQGGPLPGLKLLGGATGCDTHSATNTSPERIAAIMRAALDDAGAAPADVMGIKAHGTGTPSNDLAEARGMQQVFGETPPPFTSLKPQLGHTLGACGLIETLLFMECLKRGQQPPTLGFSTPDPELGLAPLSEPQPARDGHYLFNYFGFGGNNCTLVVERTA